MNEEDRLGMRVTALEEERARLEAANAGLRARADSLEGEVARLGAVAARAEWRVRSLRARKWSRIGDALRAARRSPAKLLAFPFTALRIALGPGVRVPPSPAAPQPSSGVAPAAPAARPAEHPKFYVPPAKPAPLPEDWPQPPRVTDAEWLAEVDAFRTAKTQPFDADLLERLNVEYAAKPVVPSPPTYDADSIAERARMRLNWIQREVDLPGTRVLDLGCGNGMEVWYLANHLGCDAYGIDVHETATWPALGGERAHYQAADLSRDNPFPESFFDHVISFAAFEHIAHPSTVLRELHRILKPGGLAWIMANLYPSAIASHLYRDIVFPWPHLLFSDDVIKDWHRRKGLPESGAWWVNRLSWSQYERSIEMVGLEIKGLRFVERPIDEDFYARFEDILSRYPRSDLEKDHFVVVLAKPP